MTNSFLAMVSLSNANFKVFILPRCSVAKKIIWLFVIHVYAVIVKTECLNDGLMKRHLSKWHLTKWQVDQTTLRHFFSINLCLKKRRENCYSLLWLIHLNEVRKATNHRVYERSHSSRNSMQQTIYGCSLQAFRLATPLNSLQAFRLTTPLNMRLKQYY